MKLLKYVALLFVLCFASQAQAASRFAVCTAACTWDGSSTAMWSASSGGATGASVPGAGDTVTLDAATCVGGVTCTITVNTTVNVGSISMGACTASTTGCILDFSVNNNNVTTPSFSGSGTGTRTLKMGSGTWSLSGVTANAWVFGTVTNATLSAASATMNFTGTLTAFSTIAFGTSFTYGTVNFGAQTGGYGFGVSCTTCTFTALGITAPNFIDFLSATTITNAFNWAGSSAASTISLIGGNVTLTVSGSSTISWASLQGMKFSTSINATNSFNANGNTNASISGPSGGGIFGVVGG